MGFENKYPYTDFHELNLDWILEQMKNLAAAWDAYQEQLTGENGEWPTFKNYIETSWATYQNNLTGPTGEWPTFKAAMEQAWADYQDDLTGVGGEWPTFKATMEGEWQQFFDTYLQTLGVVQTTGSSITDVMSQKAVTENLIIYKGSLTNININTATIEEGLYTIDPVSVSGITGYPSDYDPTDYHWLLSLYPLSFRLLFSNSQSKMWYKQANTWFRINPDTTYEQTTGSSTTTAMSQNAVTIELENKQEAVQSIVDVINSGNNTVYNTEGNNITFDEDNEKYILNAYTGSSEYYDNAAYHVTKTTVTPNKCYVIKCSTNYNNGLYAIFDANDVLITVEGSQHSPYYETDTLIKALIMPPNASYIKIAYLTDSVGYIKEMNISYLNAKWKNKKWCCVGDSLTEHNLRTTMNYHDYVAQSTGITVVNLGHSGSGYKRSYDDGNAFYQKVADVPVDSDVVTIFGSGNDMLYISDLGTITDSGTTTLCGCINTTIDNLIARMPAVQLGIVSPTPWIGEQPTIDDSNPMGQYVKALQEICYIRSIPFLDLYHCSNLRPWTAEGRAACYTKDEGNGVHPDETGHKLIAPRFEAFLDSLLL